MKSLRIFAALVCLFPSALAQQAGAPITDLDKVSIDELFSVQVMSVGREAQERSKTAAAIFVPRAEDIRRSRATCILEALEWAPGLTVLHRDGRSWVVSARQLQFAYSKDDWDWPFPDARMNNMNEARWLPPSTAAVQHAWDGTPAQVPHMVPIDARLAWRPTRSGEASLTSRWTQRF